MGMGRFGPGGCCACSPGDGGGDGGGTVFNAGPCGWCGYYTEGETLNYPIPPEKWCFDYVWDTFQNSKDFPRVPYWSWQNHTYQQAQDRISAWLEGDYHHLSEGRFVNWGRGRYWPSPDDDGWLVDTKCGAAGSFIGPGYEYDPLLNLPPANFSDSGWDWPKRPENGVIINSPSRSFDVLPFKIWQSLEFNTPINQWPKVGSVSDTGIVPVLPGFRIWASLFCTMADYGQTDCIAGPGPTSFGMFNWYDESQSPLSAAALQITAFDVTAVCEAEDDGIWGSKKILLEPYLPTTMKINVGYYIGPANAQNPSQYPGDYQSIIVPYENNFSLKAEIQFRKVADDNRKMWVDVIFYFNDLVVHQGYYKVAKPGWVQGDGSGPTDSQVFIQNFCPNRVSAVNEIRGTNSWSGGGITGPNPWVTSSRALWHPTQRPRESFWIDSWQAKLERL